MTTMKDKMIEDLQKENLQLKENAKMEVRENSGDQTDIYDNDVVYLGGSESEDDQGEPDFDSYEEEIKYHTDNTDHPDNKVKNKDEAVLDFQNKCISEIDKYYNEYINLKNNKSEKELINLQTDFFDKFQEEIIDEYLEELNENFDLDYDSKDPNCEYYKIQIKPLDKFKDRVLY